MLAFSEKGRLEYLRFKSQSLEKDTIFVFCFIDLLATDAKTQAHIIIKPKFLVRENVMVSSTCFPAGEEKDVSVVNKLVGMLS